MRNGFHQSLRSSISTRACNARREEECGGTLFLLLRMSFWCMCCVWWMVEGATFSCVKILLSRVLVFSPRPLFSGGARSQCPSICVYMCGCACVYWNVNVARGNKSTTKQCGSRFLHGEGTRRLKKHHLGQTNESGLTNFKKSQGKFKRRQRLV